MRLIPLDLRNVTVNARGENGRLPALPACVDQGATAENKRAYGTRSRDVNAIPRRRRAWRETDHRAPREMWSPKRVSRRVVPSADQFGRSCSYFRPARIDRLSTWTSVLDFRMWTALFGHPTKFLKVSFSRSLREGSEASLRECRQSFLYSHL